MRNISFIKRCTLRAALCLAMGFFVFNLPVHAQYGPVGFVNYNDGINGITGGMGGTVVEVSTREELASYAGASAPYIIIVNGKFEGTGLNRTKDIISVKSNKTIVGKKGAELAGIGLDVKNESNIIIRNLIIHHADPDAIACRNSHHIWVDHCEVYSQDEPDKEDWDGLIDLTVGSSYLTVSNCYIHDHHKACLLNSGTMHFEDNGKNRATYHHNAFVGIDQRCPRIGYGLGHVFSNYYRNIGSYAIGYHTQARVMSESNYFGSSVSNPFEQMYASSTDDASCGFLADRGSYFTTKPKQDFKHKTLGTDFNPDEWYDYRFALDSASDVSGIYPNQVGQVEGIENEPILWPGNGATDIQTNSRLRFSAIAGMTGAEVYFGTSQGNLAQTDTSAISLQPSTTYYWQVKALTADTAYLSPVYRFTTAGMKASVPTPRDGETNAQLRSAPTASSATEPMNLMWHNAASASSYDVYLSTSADDLDNNMVGTTTATTFNPGTLLYGTTYYWRVDAHNADGEVTTGDVWSFSAPAKAITEGRTEMEHLVRSAYAYLEREDGSWFKASNDSVTVGEAGPGAMTGIWEGADGTYNISVDFYDEKSGKAWMGLSVNDVQLDSWTGNKKYQMTTHSLPQSVQLRKGDQIRIDFYTNSKMRCRIDCIDINPDPTGIAEVSAPDSNSGKMEIYDLMGRRLTTITQPGIYIINHKKVYIGR